MPHQDAIRTLIEESDPEARIDAHLLLGKRALSREDETTAVMHFREALDLDPTDERPRAALLELEGAAGKRPRKMTFWRWVFRRGGADA